MLSNSKGIPVINQELPHLSFEGRSQYDFCLTNTSRQSYLDGADSKMWGSLFKPSHNSPNITSLHSFFFSCQCENLQKDVFLSNSTGKRRDRRQTWHVGEQRCKQVIPLPVVFFGDLGNLSETLSDIQREETPFGFRILFLLPFHCVSLLFSFLYAHFFHNGEWKLGNGKY